MNPSIKLDLWLALAVGCSIVTLLLWMDRRSFWMDRRRLLESKKARGHWKSAVLLYVLIVACSVGAVLGWHHVYFGGEQSSVRVIAEYNNACMKPPTQLPDGASQQSSATLSNEIAMVMAALGVFVALIIGITITTNRHSVEDIRQAGEEEAERHREHLAGLDNRYREMEVSYRNMKVLSLVEQTKINVIADIARANYLMDELQINFTPLLVSKLKFLNEARRFKDGDFSLNSFIGLLSDLEMVIKNDAYQNFLRDFFSRDDLETCKALMNFFRSSTGPLSPSEYQRAAEALASFFSQLEKIIS